jgi:uncharacterized membrane protein
VVTAPLTEKMVENRSVAWKPALLLVGVIIGAAISFSVSPWKVVLTILFALWASGTRHITLA